MVTIKKYPNRRLYDTSQSRYVNMDYIKQLIINHQDFEVVDSKTGGDVTKSILLQIVTESEATEHQSLLTNSLLKQLIRFYDGDMQIYLRSYLEQSLASFMEHQDTIQGMVKNLVEAGPLGVLNKVVEKNIGVWKKAQSELSKNKK